MTLADLIFLALVALLPRADPVDLADISAAIEATHGEYDPWTLAALVVRESSGRLDVVGKLGECGPTQVMGWYLRPKRTCAELADPLTAIQSTVQMLRYWSERRPREDPWQCYASGRKCRAARGKRHLMKIRRHLLLEVDTMVDDVYLDSVDRR